MRWRWPRRSRRRAQSRNGSFVSGFATAGSSRRCGRTRTAPRCSSPQTLTDTSSGPIELREQMWDLDDRRLDKGVQLSALFEDAPSLPVRNSANGQDRVARLRHAGSHESWQALMTPPEGPSKRWIRAGDVSVHSRPRIGALASSARTPASDEPIRGGLPPGLTRRIREYIESHLEENISLEALASTAGLSAAPLRAGIPADGRCATARVFATSTCGSCAADAQ